MKDRQESLIFLSLAVAHTRPSSISDKDEDKNTMFHSSQGLKYYILTYLPSRKANLVWFPKTKELRVLQDDKYSYFLQRDGWFLYPEERYAACFFFPLAPKPKED